MAMDAERQAEVAARIRDLRGPRPQRVIADAVGVTLRAFQAWEAGGGINWENVGPLAEALGVSEERLLYGRDEPDPSQLDRMEQQLTQLRAHQDLLEKVLTQLAEAVDELRRREPPRRRQAS